MSKRRSTNLEETLPKHLKFENKVNGSSGNVECGNQSEHGSSKSMPEETKLWGGRFSGTIDPLMVKFNDSIGYDKRLWKQDIRGSIAYARCIGRAHILTQDEVAKIEKGLQEVMEEWESGIFEIKPSDEDIHSANERRLTEKIGDLGKKLHTGRSRNDQVATDMRLWCVNQTDELCSLICELVEVLTNRAEKEMDVLMPGYTHLQRGQPIRWSHWLMSYAAMLTRDHGRLSDYRSRVNVLPLGSGALAGNPFAIDREKLAKELGFDGVTWNSMDAVGSRDVVAELNWVSSMCAVNLSRMAEDLIIYSSKEFNFVTLSDAYSTGSSLMPQKKNPDSLELIRGKCGRLLGRTFGFMTTMKGTPSTYNKDMQEDKEGTFDVVDTLAALLQISSGTLATLTVNKAACRSALSPDMLATDLAYYLVRKGVPFRTAHARSGQCVALAEKLNCSLSDLKVEDLKTVDDLFGEDASKIWDYETSVEQYSSFGGTGRSSVEEQIQRCREWVHSSRTSGAVSS